MGGGKIMKRGAKHNRFAKLIKFIANARKTLHVLKEWIPVSQASSFETVHEFITSNGRTWKVHSCNQ